MFSNLLFNVQHFGPKVRIASLNVMSHIQIESVEVGEARERNNTADVTQVWNAAENRTEAPPTPWVPQIFRLIWS